MTDKTSTSKKSETEKAQKAIEKIRADEPGLGMGPDGKTLRKKTQAKEK